MSVVQELYEITQLLYDTSKNKTKLDERDAQIEQITKLLSKRQHLLSQLQPPYSEEEKRLGQKMIQLDQEINKNLQHIFSSIKTNIKQLKQKKKHSVKYRNPYESYTLDGMFFDKRK